MRYREAERDARKIALTSANQSKRSKQYDVRKNIYGEVDL